MCEPISATMALALGGSAIGAFGQYQQMKSQQAIASYNANTERDAGYQNELAFRDQAQFDLARQKAVFSDRGVNSNSGTPLVLMARSALNKNLDALTIRRNALQQSAGDAAKARMYGAAAPLSAAAELLGGAAKFAGAGGFGDLGAPNQNLTFNPGRSGGFGDG